MTEQLVKEIAAKLREDGHDEAAAALLIAWNYENNEDFREWLQEHTNA